MTNPEANPLGAGGDVTRAALKIKELGLAHPKEPQGQPEGKPEPVKANPTDPARPKPEAVSHPPKDPATGRFVKAEPEGTETPEAAAEQPKPEASAEPAEAADDSEELPDQLEALAERIGVPPEKFMEHVKATAKINGESKAVTLKELIAGYQKGEDYSRKTAEIAEHRKAAEAERTAYQQQRDALTQRLEPFIAGLEAQQNDTAALIQKAYEQGDYQEAARLQFLGQQRQAQLDQAREAKNRADGERQRELQQKQVQYVEEQEKILFEKKPAWAKDLDKAKKELTAIRDYLKSEGVPAHTADTLHEAIPIIMAEKAMLYDKLMKEQKPAALQEVKSKPKFMVPGAAKAPVDPKKEVLRASFNKLRKTGSTKDAASVLKAMGV